MFLCFPIEMLIIRIYFNSGLSSSKLLTEMKVYVYFFDMAILDYPGLEYSCF